MPERRLQGLRGLRSFSELTPEEQDAFMKANANVLDQYHNLRKRDKAANILYMNQRFIDKYGLQKFNEMNNGSESSFDFRNQFYKDDTINAEFDRVFKNNKGFDYNKYNQLSSDAKLKLMESDYLTPTEFNNDWKKRMKESTVGTSMNPSQQIYMGAGLSLIRNISSLTNAISKGRGLSEAVGLFSPGGEEAAKKVALDKNQRILDKIYNDDVDAAANRFGAQVSEVYLNDPYLINMSDNQVKKAFIQAAKGDINKGDMGIPEFASHYGNDTDSDITSEMKDFSIDDMRQVLAKRKVYYANMSPEMASTALNNEAKRYITEHQGSLKRFGLFLNDVGISSLSYTADKVNGIYNLGLAIEDKFGDKPIVLVDDSGNVLDPNKTKLVKDRKGNLTYQGNDGRMHYVHRQQIDRTTLHNMGRNFDGSEDDGILNPQYWTRAEQFGTLDENKQKQYEKLGSSPYKVAYNPNEDSDLLYESFKMMSFGFADAASQLLPYGVGLFGKTLSAASKAGKVVQGLGKALDTTGKLLTFRSKTGQLAQGTAGALGIAYAYNRGAFQETLAQNLANTEEAVVNASKNDIYTLYNSDKKYKAGIDKLINARAATMKANYLAQMRRDGGMRIADMKAVDNMLHAKAQDAVLGELVQKRVDERKSSKEYADLQQKAIDGAGDAALNTYLTEGLKYGFVNNLGYRKFLYTNPAGLSKKLSTTLKGLKEITTEGGKKRLATEASKFLTRGQKLKEFGKTLGSQMWGGAWTNGTDDMQVDAAERINEDSFNRYLDAYQSGKALASTYGFADGLYSYVKGLQNSIGQDTTWNSAAVGGLGSVLSFTPNMANIARLATKEGREAYKSNFNKRVERDENGMPLKNEDGSLKYKDLTWKDNWRERANYLIQNGILNTYYGKKQSERDLQNHADFVNSLLDEYKDFEDIEHLVASNIASENIANDGDAKTIQYLKALQAINTLNNLGNDSKDPTSMSSVVQNAKALIEKASQLNNVMEGKDNSFSDEEISNLLSQYYAANPSIEQNEANSQKALYTIAENAKKLQEASEAFESAGNEISKIEKNKGITIAPSIKTQLMLQKALVNHWQERKEKMQSEIGDASSDDVSMDADTYIASVGGRQNAQTLVKTYNRQQKELEDELAKVKEKTAKLQENLDKAAKEYKEAYAKGTWGTTDEATLMAEANMKDAQAKVDNSKMQEDFINGMITSTANKRKSLEMDMSNMSLDETTRRVALAQEELTRYQDKLNSLREEKKKYVNKNGERDKRYSPEKLADIDKSIADYEQNVASRKETLERNKEKVLTADEIFALDPVSRARMMNKDNRSIYSKEQQREIEKLEQKLMMKDADSLQKIQDIALLTQRINTNEDAYNRIASNPLAAEKAFDEQRFLAAQEATGILNQRNAEALAGIVKMYDLSTKDKGDVTDEQRDDHAYNFLRTLNHRLLDIMDEEEWLPEHQQQLNKAKEWRKVTEDIDAVIDNSDRSEEWKKATSDSIKNILDNIDSKDDIIPTLEQIVDGVDDKNLSQDVDYILNEMKNLGYQRDATILENRKKRKEREAEEAKKRGEEQKKAEEEAKKAAEKKVEDTKEKSEEKAETDSSEEVADNGIPVGEKPDGEVTLGDEIDLDMGDEDNSSKKEGTAPKEEKESSKSQPVDEEDEHQIPDGQWNAKHLLNDDYKGGAVDMGEMYYDKDKKGNFIATREGDKITFSIDSHKETLGIESNEYETISDEQENKKNTPFYANSLEKIDGDWYFNGNFAGDKEQSQVKASKNFDIDKAIEEQQKARKEKFSAEDTLANDNHIIDEGDHIIVKSESIEEQMEDLPVTDKEVHTSDVNEDVSNLNSIGEQNIESNSTTLSGNAMSRYNMEPLVSEGKIELKKGSKADDNMNKFYAWMKAEGINLQNIIDHELARIIQNNPHAKVKFMMVSKENKALHDDDMYNHLLLVLDYDNKINKGITGIHNDDNGGVIDFNGKKYLVVGVAGYGANNPDMKVSWYRIWNRNTSSSTPSPIRDLGLIIPERAKYIKEHPNDRFYVAEDYTTEIVPKSQIPGYIVRQELNDKGTQYRSVKELLADKERNPMGYKFEDLAWGIQELSQFLVTNTKLGNVMVPRNVIGNLGSAFVLMPASNGKMVPSYLKVLKYTEMNDGALKDRINDLLQQVVAPDYQTRMKAAVELSTIFYMNKDGDFILLRKGKNEISLTHDGKVENTFILDSNFDRGEFMKAFEDMNPRINITARVLSSQDLLNEYDEAGALQTDAAMFGTAGSSYSIYALDKDGKMIIPATPVNTVTATDENSEWRNTNRRQLIFNQRYYTYNPDNADVFYLDGTMVTDDKKVSQLKRIRQILDGDFLPATSKDVWDYYVLDSSDNPVAVKVNRNTKEVKEATEEQAKALIKKLAEEEAKRKREEAAKDSTKKGSNIVMNETEDIDMGLENTDMTIDETTGEIVYQDNQEEAKPKEDTAVFGDYGDSKEEESKEITTAPKSKENTSSSQTLDKVMGNKAYKKMLAKVIKSKWKDAPLDPAGMEKFLREKNIEVDNIGSTKGEIETWIKTIEDCR